MTFDFSPRNKLLTFVTLQNFSYLFSQLFFGLRYENRWLDERILRKHDNNGYYVKAKIKVWPVQYSKSGYISLFLIFVCLKIQLGMYHLQEMGSQKVCLFHIVSAFFIF